MTEYDNPWKEALDHYFRWFMVLCFPDLSSLIDWAVAPRMMDKELQQLSPQSETGKRSVDKLVEVQMLNGEAELLLIHLEVQSQQTSDFPERMFVYFYRIRDKYLRPVVSLAVLGDDVPSWRPKRYEQELYGCRASFEFPMVKLLDFADRMDELELSENPFATIIAAHLVTMRTASNPEDRCQWKLRLLRPLYQRGMSRDDVRGVFRVLDWMMDLPTEIAISFDRELRKIEQEYEMPYVTSIERRAIEQGRQEGRQEGWQVGLLAGQIQLLQRLLQHPETALDDLLKRPTGDLQVDLQRLQAQFTDRQKGL